MEYKKKKKKKKNWEKSSINKINIELLIYGIIFVVTSRLWKQKQIYLFVLWKNSFKNYNSGK